MDDRYLYAGLIRLHVLHHAVKEPVYGLAMIEELGRHGCKLSAGTLYPILHGLEEKGYLTSSEERTGSADLLRTSTGPRLALAPACLFTFSWPRKVTFLILTNAPERQSCWGNPNDAA